MAPRGARASLGWGTTPARWRPDRLLALGQRGRWTSSSSVPTHGETTRPSTPRARLPLPADAHGVGRAAAVLEHNQRAGGRARARGLTTTLTTPASPGGRARARRSTRHFDPSRQAGGRVGSRGVTAVLSTTASPEGPARDRESRAALRARPAGRRTRAGSESHHTPERPATTRTTHVGLTSPRGSSTTTSRPEDAWALAESPRSFSPHHLPQDARGEGEARGTSSTTDRPEDARGSDSHRGREHGHMSRKTFVGDHRITRPTRASTQTSWPMSWADERVRKDCTAHQPGRARRPERASR